MTGMELKYIFDKLINRENLEMTVLLLIFFISLVGISPVVYAGPSDDNHVHVEQVNMGDNFEPVYYQPVDVSNFVEIQ